MYSTLLAVVDCGRPTQMVFNLLNNAVLSGTGEASDDQVLGVLSLVRLSTPHIVFFHDIAVVPRANPHGDPRIESRLVVSHRTVEVPGYPWTRGLSILPEGDAQKLGAPSAAFQLFDRWQWKSTRVENTRAAGI